MRSDGLLQVLLLLAKTCFYYLETLYMWVFPPTPKSVKGNVVLVTGAGSGIGREIALKFAELGAKLVLWDVNKEGNEKTAKMIVERGGFARAYVCDVTDTEAVRRVGEQARRDCGDVDVLVNNAGVLSCDTLLNLDEKKIRRTMEINAISHIITVKEFLPSMKANNEGHIITIASSAGTTGAPMCTDYCASKWAVVGFTEALSEELRRSGKTGVHTTTVCPLFVNTNMLSGIGPGKGYNPGYDPVLEPWEVAEETVQGALRNQRMVYIPRKLGTMLKINAFLPRKAQQHVRDFLKMGFNYTNNGR